MGDVVPSSEERLDVAVQGLDQLLGELQVQLATYEMSHDTPANDVQPVDDDQIEQTELEDRSCDITVAHEDLRSDMVTKTTTEGQEEEADDASREASSSQPAHSPAKVNDSLFRTQGDTIANIAQQH